MESEEDEESVDWLTRSLPDPSAPPQRIPGASSGAGGRVIVHIDMDCFYAQVEMIRNPHLKDQPVGVQQKHIVVTCNYEARRLGVHKLMAVREATEKCPQLVLVSGEDLTHYREISYRVSELLEGFSPKVERLGFDENFIDVTELVDKRLQALRQSDGNPEVSVSGHVYNHQTVNLTDPTHLRLAAGSQVAADIRAEVHARLGLTGCAGVASNKLLAKLVSGTFKPNQQTVLLPESSAHLVDGLGHVMKVPGIGYRTAQRLESMKLRYIRDLQACPLIVLEKEFGRSAAVRMQTLCRGEDDSPVTPKGLPQSLSDEDSFRKCSTVLEVKEKMKELLGNLLIRLSKDGRNPHTLRLTIRQFHPTNKWFNRESRQCSIPSHVIQSIGTENKDVTSPLMDLLMKLFEKMINVKMPFHLTLINVCFSNMKASGSARNSMGFYLTQKAEQKGNRGGKEKDGDTEDTQREGSSSAFSEEQPRSAAPHPYRLTSEESPSASLAEDIDMDVFSQLPDEIKQEIMSSPAYSRAHKSIKARRASQPTKGIQSFFSKAKGSDPPAGTGDGVGESLSDGHTKGKLEKKMQDMMDEPSTPNITCSLHEPTEVVERNTYPLVESIRASTSHSHATSTGVQDKEDTAMVGEVGMDCGEPRVTQLTVSFPKSVDQKVFSELPADLQKELLSEWKQQKHTPKIQAKKRLEDAKAKRTHTPKRKPNSLLKYFKPG
uniref:DNA polymerase iota n=1 Tax=Leptobrachium leishanense TaxID=445787 RepID=A0A8C5LXC0_9ANUR